MTCRTVAVAPHSRTGWHNLAGKADSSSIFLAGQPTMTFCEHTARYTATPSRTVRHQAKHVFPLVAVESMNSSPTITISHGITYLQSFLFPYYML